MTIARRLLVPHDQPGLYHCISRCVRRAFLCGDEFDHRRDWIRDRLQELASVFAIDVAAYSVMSNHLHTVLRKAPDRASDWSARIVVERWSRIFPQSILRWAGEDPKLHKAGDEVPPRAIAFVAGDAKRVKRLRRRLASLSWFMKCLKEPIARRANREDDCTGCFWEGRFKSHSLLDDAAVLACMVYVDLNPIRAKVVATPEDSDYTSVQDRVHVRQHFEKLEGRRKRSPKRAVTLLSGLSGARTPRTAEDGIWLAPIQRRRARSCGCGRTGLLDLSLDDYLEIVDATGRVARRGKGGSIPPSLLPVLERLHLDAERWTTTMATTGRMFGTAIGAVTSLAAEAVRRRTRWVVGAIDVHRVT